MWDRNISFFYALIFHILLVVVLFNAKSNEMPILTLAPMPEKVMQVIAIDEIQWFAKIKASNKIQGNKTLNKQRRELKRKKRKIKQKVAKESQRLDSLYLQQEAEQQRLAKIKQQQQEELETLELLEQWKAAKQKRLADAKKAKRQAQLESQRQSEQKELLNQFIRNVAQKVGNSWVRPRGYYGGLSCIVEIRLQQGGGVYSVKVVQSSGNLVFDYSAKKAVYKASPLPVSDGILAIDELLDTNKFVRFRFNFKR